MKKSKKRNNKIKKDYSKIFLKILLILLIIDIVFIPLCIYAEVKPLVGLTIFILFPLMLAICVVLLSRNCFNSYERKKKVVLEKLNK